SPKTTSALDIGHLVLSSAPGGNAATRSHVSDTSTSNAPAVHVVKQGRASMTLQIDPTDAPFWLVLGESQNRGWVARVDGRSVGHSQIVDGYANGWHISPRADGRPINVTLDWQPQHTVWHAILVSLLAGIACVGIMCVGFGRRRNRTLFTHESALPSMWQT